MFKSIKFSFFSFIISLFLILVLISTAYDYFQKLKDGELKFLCKVMVIIKSSSHFQVEANKLLISFSAYTNTKELFDTSRSESADAVGYLSGMKGLSYFGIIVIHSVLSRLWFPLRDPRDAEYFLDSFLAPLINGFFHNVDTFLLITGILITKTILKDLDKQAIFILMFEIDNFTF